MKRILTLLAALAVYAAAAAQPIPDSPEFRTGRLANGMTYYIAHNENPKGCAEFYIAHNVGALQEEDNQNGLAHFLEHMAFNGLKHYPGNSMLKFLAKDGVRFGYNVNAFTTRRETVYNISAVPLARESFVDSVLLILHDWSHDISCEPQALDDERGVISEEYRLRDDPRSRMARMQNDLVYKGAKQSKRSVIGTLEVINGFKREEILDFYHKWYRPDLQAIIIVGDFDTDWMEAKVRRSFADIPMPENAPAKELYPPVPQDGPLFEDMTDNRIRFNVFKIFYKQPYPSPEERGGEAYLKDWFCRNIISSVLSERLKKATKDKGAPTKSAVLVTSEYEPDYYVSLFTITPNNKDLLGKSLEFTYREIARLLRHGISPREFEVAKLATAQRFHLDRELSRDGVKNEQLVNVALGHFLKNHPLVHPVDLKDIEKRVLGEISYKDIVPYPGKMFRDSEVIYSTCYNPVEEPGIAPSPEQIKAILSAVDAEEIGPSFLEYTSPDMSVTALPGKIRKVVKKKDYELWKLSNGAKVYYRKAKPVETNDHLAAFWHFDTGRKSYEVGKETSSRIAAGFIAQNLGFRGCEKSEYRNFPELSGFSYLISSVKADLTILAGKGKEENAFKTVFLTLSEPYFGKQLEKTKENRLKSLEKKKTNRNLFDQRCDRELYGNHPWMQEIDSAAVQAVDMQLVEDVFRRKYGDPSKLSVFITSDLDRSRIEDYVCRYVAALSGDYPYRMSKTPEPKPLVKGEMVIAEEHPRESEPLTSIYYAFYKDIKTTSRNLVVSDFLDYILSARYNDLIREERGGAYHVGFSSVVPDDPSQPWKGVVSFQTRPEMKDILLQDVKDVMDRMCAEGPTPLEMEMAGRYIRKRHVEEEARVARSLGMQLDRLVYTALWGRDYNYDFNKVIDGVTPADVQKMARQFASGDILKEIYTEK